MSVHQHQTRLRAVAVAALQALLLAGCAHAGARTADFGPAPLPPGPPPQAYDQVLSQLPDDAPPGECYARVVIPGQPIIGPPQAQGASWVLNPGPPGSPGPIWCLVPTGPAPVAYTPERDGFIRVLCDTDATPARVEGWQRRLHEEGYYEGGYTGRYDAPTADAVGRYQKQRHIAHGGYLSRETVDALESPPPPRHYAKPAPAPKALKKHSKSEAYAAASAGGVGYAPYPAVAQQPVYGQPAYPSYPSYPQAYPAPPQAYAYPQAGYVQRGYAAGSSSSSYSSQSSYSSSAGGGYGQAYGYAAPGQSYGYSYGYAAPPQAYGYAQQGAYGQSYGYGQAYGYAQQGGYDAYGYGPNGPRPAYAAPRSAIQNGWLTWDGKPRF